MPVFSRSKFDTAKHHDQEKHAGQGDSLWNCYAKKLRHTDLLLFLLVIVLTKWLHYANQYKKLISTLVQASSFKQGGQSFLAEKCGLSWSFWL